MKRRDRVDERLTDLENWASALRREVGRQAYLLGRMEGEIDRLVTNRTRAQVRRRQAAKKEKKMDKKMDKKDDKKEEKK